MPQEVLIKHSSLPPRPPILFAIVLWLLLDRLDVPGWVHGVVWTWVAILAAVFIHRMRKAVLRDVPGFGEE